MEGAFNSSMPLPFSYTFTFTPGASSADVTDSVTVTSPWMDTRIWSKLPLTLIDRVIAFLPPPAFFRARCVCKRCSTSDSGGKATATDICEGYLFDPYDIAWYRISFALVPSGFSPAAVSGGLICWISDEAGAKSIILCNPLIGYLSQLPPTLRPRLFPSIGLRVGPSSIDVAVAGDDLISPYAQQTVGARFKLQCGDSYVRQDWSRAGGKLLLVAAVEKSKLNVPKSLRLWCLQPCGTTWIEIERMPQQLYLQFAELEVGHGFDCVGHGEFIAIIIRGSIKVLLFDILRKIWQWIPPCSCIDGFGGDDDELHGFAYEPTVTTPVTGLLDQLTIPFQSFTG
ncbi:hypothetical protein OIU77_027588 [Salix suchowensis]|uniref:F-box domain-containing protein n=1 Tax=Salix suchowensis TaxID=1278906 RepID=A0ABQ9BQ82_9ROSI|nr:hypothetical protein OIU77_027588 [Salix suchowensis]